MFHDTPFYPDLKSTRRELNWALHQTDITDIWIPFYSNTGVCSFFSMAHGISAEQII
jgi:uncharacterized protein (DUF2062 family)